MSFEPSPFKVALRDCPATSTSTSARRTSTGGARDAAARRVWRRCPRRRRDRPSSTSTPTARAFRPGHDHRPGDGPRAAGAWRRRPVRFAEDVRVTYLPAAGSRRRGRGRDPGRRGPGRAKAAAKGGKPAGKGDKAAGKGDKAAAAKDDCRRAGPRDSPPTTSTLPVPAATPSTSMPLIREQFVLAVAFAPLCKDDCLGLCAQCGVDRNVESCRARSPSTPVSWPARAEVA